MTKHMQMYARKPMPVRVIEWDGTADCFGAIRTLAAEYGKRVDKEGDVLTAQFSPEKIQLGDYVVAATACNHWKPPAFHANFDLVEIEASNVPVNS